MKQHESEKVLLMKYTFRRSFKFELASFSYYCLLDPAEMKKSLLRTLNKVCLKPGLTYSIWFFKSISVGKYVSPSHPSWLSQLRPKTITYLFSVNKNEFLGPAYIFSILWFNCSSVSMLQYLISLPKPN